MGSPFRKARRNRDERKKTVEGKHHEPTEAMNAAESMVNVSPLRKARVVPPTNEGNEENTVPGQQI